MPKGPNQFCEITKDIRYIPFHCFYIDKPCSSQYLEGLNLNVCVGVNDPFVSLQFVLNQHISGCP